MKKLIKYNVILHNKLEFDECLKRDFRALDYKTVDTNKINGITEGRIYIAESVDSPVEWIDELNMYTQTQLNKDEYNNKSNKAVMMLKYNGRIFSILYGYGRTMLKTSSIIKNFGLRTAINLISDEAIKSMATLNFSDDYVDTQRQALNFVSQNSLYVNTNSEIMKSISGKASSDSIFSSIHGSDNILFSASSDSAIIDVLSQLIEANESERYKEKGFEWIDYIQPVKEDEVISYLNEQLLGAINSSEFDRVSICLNRIIEHGEVGGYFIKGMNQGMTYENFYDEIPSKMFFEYLKNTDNINLQKLKNSSLYFWNETTSEQVKVDSVYNCILFEADYENERYFINNGDWFKIESNYFTRILSKIRSIPKSLISAIPCTKQNESDYNKEFANEDKINYKLFDKNNFQPTEWGRSKVEPADIITREGEFLHIKKGGASATLSHLFAQGLVSSQLLKNEQEFRKYINDDVSQVFGDNYIDNIEPEIVFGIIDKRYNQPVEQFLPVFSMINLCQAYDNIINLGYKCSILPIEEGISEIILNKKEQEVLEWIKGNLDEESTAKEILDRLQDSSDINIKESTFKKYLKKFQGTNFIESSRVGRSFVYKLSTN